MSINNHLNQVLQEFLAKPEATIENAQLISCIDLTLLNENSSDQDISKINLLAEQHKVAAVCVFPQDLVHFPLPSSIGLATVINFPYAEDSVANCLKQIDKSKLMGVTEIDYVLPYKNYLKGQKQQAIQHAFEIATHCKANQLAIKIILESGAFTDLAVLYELAQELISLDIDFLKTSTGKISEGASLSAAFTLLSAIKDSGKSCGLKVSGGVKTVKQAQNYAQLAQYFLNKPIESTWFRIGASSLLEELTKTN